MDMSKVDWWHVAGVTAIAAVAGPVALGALGIGAVATGVAGALGVTLTGATFGLAGGAASVVGQAKK